VRFHDNFLPRYVREAPLPLAIERSIECELYTQLSFERPILDVGCGEGLFAKILFAEPIDTGIDPNARELERARELGAYNELIECYGNAIPKADATYRTVFSNSVLEHIPDLEPVLREVYRVLAPGGRFYFTVPSHRFDQYTVGNQVLSGVGLRGLAARFRAFYDRFWAHYHYYTLDGWQALARKCGFEVVESFTYDPKRVCLMNDALVPFSLPAMIAKKLTNRWVLVPWLHRLLVAPMTSVAQRAMSDAARTDDGGLVFMSLVKKSG